MSRTPWCYVEAPLTPATVRLSAEEAHHVRDVLRLRIEAAVVLFDGDGRWAAGAITAADRDCVTVTIQTVQEEEPPRPALTVATAIPKGKRWQSLVEKCTELGADAIQPVRFARSVAGGGSDPAKWQRWALEACKQCGRARLPVLHGPIALADLLAQAADGPRLVADAGGDPLLQWGGQLDRAETATILVGPEGGLTDAERQACEDAAWAPVRLAKHVLRVETAAMAACALARGLV